MDEKLKAYWTAFKTEVLKYWKALCDFISHNKFIFLVIVPLIILAKFRDIASQFLTWKSQQEVDADKKKNDTLETEVKKDNDQANALVQHAEQTAENKPTVDENWDKK